MEVPHVGFYELTLGGVGVMSHPPLPVINAKFKRRVLVVLKIGLILQEQGECGSPPVYYLQLQKGKSNSSISHHIFKRSFQNGLF